MDAIDAVVTGATGLLGSHVVRRLVDDGARVRCLVRPTSRTAHIEGPQVELVTADLHQSAALAAVLKGVRLVFHFAGHITASAPLNADEDDSVYSLTLESSKALLEAAAMAGVGRFVYVSSVGVYGADAVSPIGEDTLPDPVSAYGRSKVAAEAAVMEYHRRGLPCTVIRPSICYGAGDRHFLPAARRMMRLPVLPLVDGGRHLLDIASAIDVAGLAVTAASAPRAVGRVYNASSGHPVALRDIIAILHEVEGTPRPLILTVSEGLMRFAAPVAQRIAALLVPGMESTMSAVGASYSAHDVFYDMTRAKAEIGFQPRYDFRRGLEAAREAEASAVRGALPTAP
jgi:dihydroflavonol-4-reductase